MKKPATIQISIPKPCNEEWDKMTPSAEGHFCAHCQKNVIDFTGYSDNALYNFFSNAERGKVCGRFLASQVSRPIHIPYQPQSKLYRIAIALGLTLMFTQVPVQAKVKPPLIFQTTREAVYDNDNISSNQQDTTGIKGTVLDDKKEPVVQAVVQVIKNGVVITGTTTDFDGNYIIQPLEQGMYDVTVKGLGYKETTITSVPINANQLKVINVSIETGGAVMGEMIQVQYKIPLINKFNPDENIISGYDIKRMPGR